MAETVSNQDCLDCHIDPTTSRSVHGKMMPMAVFPTNAFQKSVHAKLNCTDCHVTIKEMVHPSGLPPAQCASCHDAQAKLYASSIHGMSKAMGASPAASCADCHGAHGVLSSALPDSPLYFANLAETCGQCHKQESADVMDSVHGKAIAAGRRDAPTCTDCHSEHQIQTLKKSSSLAISQDICGKCHESERLNTKYNLPADRVKTFFASYHGLAAQYGSTRTANCSSCHGVHKIFPSTDPRSTISRDNLAATCGRCHPGADAKFAQGPIHIDIASAEAHGNLGERINWWVRKIYMALIFAVIGLMAGHNALIFGRKAAARARSERRTVLRMDFSQRAQHFVLAFSFILLAATGFALKFPDSWIARLLGSNENIRRWGHRSAGVALLLAGVYHVGYLLFTRQGQDLVKDMLPGKRDAGDVVANVRFLCGLARQRPRFARFGYAEKMEYWAVVWGTVIMGATGLLIWFKLGATHWLPRWSIDVATTIHYYEAILACLAILVWHFYHVVFDPDVYPLSRACLDGRVSAKWYGEEHALDANFSNGSPTQTQEITSVSMKATNDRSNIIIHPANGRTGDPATRLHAGDSRCSIVPFASEEVLRLVLLGAPGVGKGTQAELLHQWCGACHLSTGDIFRAAKRLPPAEQSAAIKKALGYMARGALVPDQTVVALVYERLRCMRCAGGFLLDGFPRTVAQAEALERFLTAEDLPLTGVIDYEMPVEKIVERLAGRRVCSICNAVTHVDSVEASPAVCSHCGGKLYQREDDRPEAIRIRMEAYHKSTEPLIEYYSNRHLLVSVCAEGTPEEVLQRTVDALALLNH